MQQQDVDIVIVGGGGAGLRAAIAAAEQAKQSGHAQRIALVSKVYPMRSHTVAAEGGAAGVISGSSLKRRMNRRSIQFFHLHNQAPCSASSPRDATAYSSPVEIRLRNCRCGR